MNGLQVKYTLLTTVFMEHLFYENGVCRKYFAEPEPDLEFLPTDECKDYLGKTDLLFKLMPHKGGFGIFARVFGKTPGGLNIIRAGIGPGHKLTFLVTLRNAELINFND